MQKHRSEIVDHYQKGYFDHHQREYGEFGGRANKFMFEKHVGPADVVLDFGCGGGFLLKNLVCGERIGIEINPVARDHCNHINGIKCYESLDFVPDESIDVVISSHCLEHTQIPTSSFRYYSGS